LPISLVFIVVYYFTNRYYDSKETHDNVKIEKKINTEESVPIIYSLIPILPIILLIFFSKIMNSSIILDTSTAMFISVFVAIIFELIFKRNLKEVFKSLNIFWSGMGNIFKTVVTLIIVADIFASGLLSLNFINALIYISENLGLVGIGVVMVILIFLSAMIMGSGNAAFFSFGPLAPEISQRFNIEAIEFILPMNLAASMGRTVSPVSGVLIATAEIAQVSSMQIVKRNLIPMLVGLIVMIIYHFI